MVLPNPFEESKGNYTISFFKKQWINQCSFRADHTNEEQERIKQLIDLYEHWSTLEVLKTRLLDPTFHLLSKKEVNKVFDNVKKVSKELKKLEETLSDQLLSDENDEHRLLLLLYKSKKELYVQAVHLHPERQPLLDAKRLGNRVGTTLKEKIMKAMRDRTPAIKKLLDKFNKHLAKYLEKFPDQTLRISLAYPLRYEEFSKMPLDHDFWNNGLYFQLTASWAVEPNVRTGTNCVLILSRLQEEYQLIAQELARAVGWGVSHYRRFSDSIAYLSQRITRLESENNNNVEDV
ncbi:hypothetical protein PCASD_24805 [Puccinia coronata f. sp. avenae]|uniref:Uncharacterized protein n=1 Tax=Puccinia coronata f. sp. avenae TaxID=200324 RepID=A0A2N5S7V6_9BASI|nr:hypothetical protein PCASD_24805 [Puccinia coronata f. sp. avenae]